MPEQDPHRVSLAARRLARKTHETQARCATVCKAVPEIIEPLATEEEREFPTGTIETEDYKNN